MEIIYLWIKSYKNIQNMGFHLSPNFKCKYNPKKGEIDIQEKRGEEVAQILPDNINITAIVGENGSGKSSLIETMLNIGAGDLLIYREDDKLYYSGDMEIKSNLKIVKRDLKPDSILDWRFDKIDIGEYLKEVKAISRIFKFEFWRTERLKDYKSLSSGEQELFSQLLFIYKSIRDGEEDNYLIVLDGADVRVHPKLQKRYITILIEFLSQHFPKKRVHTVMTTQSPLIISDIPKESIIFLSRDGDGNCKLYESKYRENTFGANLYTIFSSSLYVEDGLMGEFAEWKINEVIEQLKRSNIPDSRVEQCSRIISEIGEPVVRRRLEKMVDRKKRIDPEEVEALKQNIFVIQNRLNMLRKLNGKNSK